MAENILSTNSTSSIRKKSIVYSKYRFHKQALQYQPWQWPWVLGGPPDTLPSGYLIPRYTANPDTCTPIAYQPIYPTLPNPGNYLVAGISYPPTPQATPRAQADACENINFPCGGKHVAVSQHVKLCHDVTFFSPFIRYRYLLWQWSVLRAGPDVEESLPGSGADLYLWRVRRKQG